MLLDLFRVKQEACFVLFSRYVFQEQIIFLLFFCASILYQSQKRLGVVKQKQSEGETNF